MITRQLWYNCFLYGGRSHPHLTLQRHNILYIGVCKVRIELCEGSYTWLTSKKDQHIGIKDGFLYTKEFCSPFKVNDYFSEVAVQPGITFPRLLTNWFWAMECEQKWCSYLLVEVVNLVHLFHTLFPLAATLKTTHWRWWQNKMKGAF